MSDDKVVVVPYSKKLVGDYQGQEKKDVLWLQGGLLVCEAANQKTYNSCGCEEEHGNHHQLMPLDHITTTNVARVTQKHPSLLIWAMLFAFGLPLVVQQYDLGVLVGGAVVSDRQCLSGRTGQSCHCRDDFCNGYGREGGAQYTTCSSAVLYDGLGVPTEFDTECLAPSPSGDTPCHQAVDCECTVPHADRQAPSFEQLCVSPNPAYHVLLLSGPGVGIFLCMLWCCGRTTSMVVKFSSGTDEIVVAWQFEGKEDKEFHKCKAYKAAMQVEQARIEFLARSAGEGGSGAPPMVMPQQQLPQHQGGGGGAPSMVMPEQQLPPQQTASAAPVMPHQQLPPQHTAAASLAHTQMVQVAQSAQIRPQPQDHVENPMSNEGASNPQDFLAKRMKARQKVEAPDVEDPDSDPWDDAGLPPNSSSGQSDV